MNGSSAWNQLINSFLQPNTLFEVNPTEINNGMSTIKNDRAATFLRILFTEVTGVGPHFNFKEDLPKRIWDIPTENVPLLVS